LLHYFRPVIRELAFLDGEFRAILRASVQHHLALITGFAHTPQPETSIP